MRYFEIVESPQIIPDEDWQLTDPKVNRARVESILKYSPEVLEIFPAAKLVRLAGEHGGQYALIGKDNILEYYVHYEVAKIPRLGRCATQVKLWRMRTASVQGLASKVFDTYLLASFDTIVSDSRQTIRGKEFWEVQLGGHSQSHTIGLLIGNDIKIYDKSQRLNDWLSSVDGWGTESKFRRMRFFISNLHF